MCATYYSTEQLYHAAGVTKLTILRHIRQGWLQPESIPGVRGFRFRSDRAQRWLKQRFPTVPVTKLDEPLPPPPEWKALVGEFTGHLVTFDPSTGRFSTPCGCVAQKWAVFDDQIGKPCKQCLGAEKKLKKR